MDPQNWTSVQDHDTDSEGRLLKADKYGYAMAASSLDIAHHVQVALQSCISETMAVQAIDEPSLLCYATDLGFFKISSLSMNHEQSNLLPCPSQETGKQNDVGLFDHPKHPAEVNQKDQPFRYHLLLGIKLVNILNAALCQRHMSVCPQSGDLEDACQKVAHLDLEIKREEDQVKFEDICTNAHGACAILESQGKCYSEFLDMSLRCRNTCKFCHHQVHNLSSQPSDSLTKGTYTARNISEGESQRARGLTLWVLCWISACALVVISLLRILSRPIKAPSLKDWRKSRDSFYEKPVEAKL